MAEVFRSGCGNKLGRGLTRKAAQLVYGSASGRRIWSDAHAMSAGTGLVGSVDTSIASCDDDIVEFTRRAIIHALGDVWSVGGVPTDILASVRLRDYDRESAIGQFGRSIRELADHVGVRIGKLHTSLSSEPTEIATTVIGRVERPVECFTPTVGMAVFLTSFIQVGTIDEPFDWIGKCEAGSSVARMHGMARCKDVSGDGLIGCLSEMAEMYDLHLCIHPELIPFRGNIELGDDCELDRNMSDYLDMTYWTHAPNARERALFFKPQFAGPFVIICQEFTKLHNSIKVTKIGTVGDDACGVTVCRSR